MSTEKDVQLENCKLSLIWGQMRTAAWEVASEIALRDCSKATVRESKYISFGEGWVQYHEAVILQKVFCQSWGSDITMKGFSASLDMPGLR